MRYALNLLQFFRLIRGYPRRGTRGGKTEAACARSRSPRSRTPASRGYLWCASIPAKELPVGQAVPRRLVNVRIPRILIGMQERAEEAGLDLRGGNFVLPPDHEHLVAWMEQVRGAIQPAANCSAAPPLARNSAEPSRWCHGRSILDQECAAMAHAAETIRARRLRTPEQWIRSSGGTSHPKNFDNWSRDCRRSSARATRGASRR